MKKTGSKRLKFSDYNEEWLFLSFYPQEDIRQLRMYRRQFSPFLKSVVKGLNFDLDNLDTYDEAYCHRKKSLCDEIIREGSNLTAQRTLSPSQSLPTLNTLRSEHDQLALNFRFENFWFTFYHILVLFNMSITSK